MDENKKFELSDDELDQVVGGLSVGDRVKVDSSMVRYCPGCGNLASIVTGTIVGKTYYEKGGYYFVEVKSDCCGYVERALESICTAQWDKLFFEMILKRYDQRRSFHGRE